MRPHVAVARARIKVPVPMMACIGTSPALNLAVPLSQARRARKLNRPTINYNANLVFIKKDIYVVSGHLKRE